MNLGLARAKIGLESVKCYPTSHYIHPKIPRNTDTGPQGVGGGDKKMISTEVVLAMAHSNHILGYGNDVDQEPEARQHQDRAPEVGCEGPYDIHKCDECVKDFKKKKDLRDHEYTGHHSDIHIVG